MAGRGIVIQIQGDGESARRALEMVQEHLQETAEASNEASSEMAENWERVKSALEFTGIYMGLEELREGFKELIEGSLELGEKIEQSARKTGLSVESLSVLHYAAGLLGTDFDGIVNAVGRFDTTIGKAASGNKEAAALMKALGLNATELAGRQDGAEIAFHKFVATLAATENPVRRAELAQQALGKAGREQIPVLLEVAENWDAFKAKAQAAGVLLDGETAESLAATNQRLADMKQHLLGAGLAVTEGMSPGLSQMFGVIESGKSSMESMSSWGRGITMVLATVAETAYVAKGMISEAFADIEFAAGVLSKSAHDQALKDVQSANDAYKKAREMFDIAKGAQNGTLGKDAAPFLPKGEGPRVPGFKGTDPPGGTKRVASDNAIPAAAAALADAEAKAAADRRKVADQVQLAELEAQHKMLLVSDQSFYAEKLRLQAEELDAEQTALEAKQNTLQALYERQHGDKTLKRDKSGTSAEELRTERELVDVGRELNELTARRAQLTSAATAESSAANQTAALAGLKAMAELEKERGEGITAQVALLRQEHELEAQKITREGGTAEAAAAARAQGELLVKKLEIEQVSQRIADVERDYARQVELINDKEQKGQITKKQAAEEINALHATEVQQLQATVDLYSTLAGVLGGEYKEKALDLQAELDKLGTPDRKDEAKFAKSVADGVAQMATTIAEKTAEGRESFHKMVADMEHDAERLVIKLAEEAFLKPALEGTFAGFGQGGRKGGGLPATAAALLPAAPALWTPPAQAGGGLGKASGGVLAGLLSKLTGGGAGGGKDGPGVTIVIQNNSSQPVSAQEGASTFDGTSWVKNIILTDLAQGDVLSTAFKGMLASG